MLKHALLADRSIGIDPGWGEVAEDEGVFEKFFGGFVAEELAEIWGSGRCGGEAAGFGA